MSPVKPRIIHSTLPTNPLDIVMTMRVSTGSSSLDPKSLNMFSNPGMTNVNKMVSTPKKTKMTMLG